MRTAFNAHRGALALCGCLLLAAAGFLGRGAQAAEPAAVPPPPDPDALMATG